MACKTLICSAFTKTVSVSSSTNKKITNVLALARSFHHSIFPLLNRSENGAPLNEDDHRAPQETVVKSISGVLETQGKVEQTTNIVFGGTLANNFTIKWLESDQKVNSYPMVRGFIAIGTGGDDFVQAMTAAVTSVIRQPIPQGHIRKKISSRGKYVSVNIGPLQVISSEQVQAVYNAMMKDERTKYFL